MKFTVLKIVFASATMGVLILGCSADEFTGDTGKRFATGDVNGKRNDSSGSVDGNGTSGDDANGQGSSSNGDGRNTAGQNGIGQDAHLNSVCRYFDPRKASSPDVMFQFPEPLAVDKKTGGQPLPISVAGVLMGGGAVGLLLAQGPVFDITQFTLGNKGQWVGNDYQFAFTAYRAGTAAEALAGAMGTPNWTLTTPQGPILIEVQYRGVVQNGRSPSCSLTAHSVPITRGDIMGDPSGCFDQDAQITMADGNTKAIKLIEVGDKVLNPATGVGASVAEVIFGPEREKPMYEIVTNKGRTLVTSTHPFVTQHGLKQAQELSRLDLILDSKSIGQKILNIHVKPISKTQNVYNLRLDHSSQDVTHHMVVADGIPTADLLIQRNLESQRRTSYNLSASRDAEIRRPAK